MVPLHGEGRIRRGEFLGEPCLQLGVVFERVYGVVDELLRLSVTVRGENGF